MTEQIKVFKEKENYTLADIRELVEILRSKDGCAWDREQTHKSVRNAMIEETYEFIEGLDKNDETLMKEELGDVMFQVFFHARIAEEEGSFNIDDIADEICKKMVLRHPHVFGDVSVKDSGEVLKNWETIKKAEKSRDTLEKQLESVSSALPSLIRAEKLFSRCKKEGVAVERDPEKLIRNITALHRIQTFNDEAPFVPVHLGQVEVESLLGLLGGDLADQLKSAHFARQRGVQLRVVGVEVVHHDAVRPRPAEISS